MATWLERPVLGRRQVSRCAPRTRKARLALSEVVHIFRRVSSEDQTATTRYLRGSEWRRWDLHIHTPYSVLNNGFGSDFDAYAKSVFEQAIAHDIAVIGVTDYFSVDGYKELRELQDDPNRLAGLIGEESIGQAQEILLLPNVELRLGDLVHVGAHDSRTNMHVIFSNEVPLRDIEENFLHRLEFTSHAAPDAKDEKKTCTRPNLEDLGARLKEEHEPFRSDSDLKVGMTQATVSHTQITDLLERMRSFDKRHLILLAADEDVSDISWDGQGHHTRKLLVQKSHMLWSSNPRTRSFGLGDQDEMVEKFETEFNARKPCINGSDAHKVEELFLPAGDRQLWIRADPTFNGLAQLLYEPEGRVFIGPEPPSLARIRAAATKSIDELRFSRAAAAGAEARWFTGAVPLNAGLVAIIGKKGSGKSALADVIALVGDAHTRADFSFLSDNRFLNPKHGLGRHFRAELLWRSEESKVKRLDEEGDPSLPERVKYIPQNYLEKVCGEIQGTSARTLFDEELESVIFSHVPRPDRLGRSSLRALFEHTTEETESRIKLLRDRLEVLNRDYVTLRRRGSEESRRTLAARLAQRKGDLDAHRKSKPAEVPDPKADAPPDPDAAKAEVELQKVVAEIEAMDAGGAELRKQDEEAKRKRVAVGRLLKRIENFNESLEVFYEQSAEDVGLLGFDIRKLVAVEIDVSELEKLNKKIEVEIEGYADALDVDRAGSPAEKRAAASRSAEELRHKLGAPQRRFQEYQRQLAHWRKVESEIDGSVEDPDSVKGLEGRLQALQEIPREAEKKREERDLLMREIFAAKSELLETYQALYSPVQEFIDGHEVAREENSLSFSAVIAVDGLEDGILAMIHQGRRGSFQGDQEGRERLRALIKTHDFSSADGVAAFLAELGENLNHDLRQEDPPAYAVEDQLVQGADPEHLYDFLFGLTYLEPRFKLLWRNKPLDQLSPGERGTLLLIFYLLIDRQDLPLVIDQPEENLDNETVAELLVPAVKFAKDRRQIIMVTHNPNLAVVCDADQIVHASIDKADGNRITYTSGSIEDPEINKLIVDVLEGTKPAFDLRDEKYDVLERTGHRRATAT